MNKKEKAYEWNDRLGSVAYNIRMRAINIRGFIDSFSTELSLTDKGKLLDVAAELDKQALVVSNLDSKLPTWDEMQEEKV